MGPEKTIDGSGLTGTSTAPDDRDVAEQEGVTPIWIQYEFDRVYKLHQMWVWNSNPQVESFIGFGVKDVTIETSTDGTTWTPLTTCPNSPVDRPERIRRTTPRSDLGGVQAKYVKLTVNANWSRWRAQYRSERGAILLRARSRPAHRSPRPGPRASASTPA